jgi:hypothetical protein
MSNKQIKNKKVLYPREYTKEQLELFEELKYILEIDKNDSSFTLLKVEEKKILY